MLSFAFIYVFLIGLVIGSFLNCLVWRLYKGETVGGRSYCPRCHHQLNWYDNIPLFSFLNLRGRCRHCHHKISWQYPLGELATGILFVLAFWQQLGYVAPDMNTLGLLFSQPLFYLRLLFAWLVIALSVIVFIYDCRWFLVSVSVAVYGAIACLLFNLAIAWQACGLAPVCFSWQQMILAPAIGIAFFGLQYILTRGRGLGAGDIWLGGLIGFMFPSLEKFLLVLFITYIIGAASGLTLLALKLKKLQSKLPLGIFLALGVVITLLFGQELLDWYRHLFLGF
jgi:prepilin signal peptidase PulO-like enzyme (type II secretory pathway)